MFEKIILTPFQKFIKLESFSGILLFIATVVALLWANSPYRGLYDSIWQYRLGFTTGSFELYKPLILWINDGLMAIFFFLIGLEIKRELLIGELNSVKRAAFPFLAAFGGMLAPVTIYILLNNDPGSSHGWGIPMATDIAFSLAIIRLLGNRVPLSLKIFLTAFAIIDDIGAVLVIAIFYSTGIKWILLLYAMILLIILAYLSYRRIYAKYFILVTGIVVWFLFLKSGVHPTVAGVLLAFTIPSRQRIDIKTYRKELKNIVCSIDESEENQSQILSDKQIEQIDNLEDWTSQVQSPLQHLEHRLHNWVAYFIMPLFALANAGVTFGSSSGTDIPLVLTLAASLTAGNLAGVMLMTFIGQKLKLTEIPAGINYTQLLGVSFLAGVGFTMSIFIANLAFGPGSVYLESAKIGILLGSLVSGLTGYLILRFAGSRGTGD